LDVKLRHLDEWNCARRRHAIEYDKKLAQIGVQPPARRSDEGHVYHLYVIEVEQRDRIAAELRDRGIQTGIHYPIPIHLQPAYAELNLGAGSYPRTEAAAHRVLSLPMFPELTDEQIERVVDTLASSRSLVVA
ncbi:MAG: DegT/DnrJ/EryC1/StrS family aminotransferase, partial [Candidatus Eremiobacteraeota bacterium]|nr:DegT/DnrJ/EryC1/StrS family aminotransferase [Candidatus Eremiobacteraeota bacterium]